MTARLSTVVLVKCNGVGCSSSTAVAVTTSLVVALDQGAQLVGTLDDTIEPIEAARSYLRIDGWSSPAVGVASLDFCPDCTKGRSP